MLVASKMRNAFLG